MTIKDAKDAADIVTVIEACGTTLQKKGVEWVGLCPFHTDSKPSLFVNQRKQVFGCFACDTKGDVIDFVAMLYNLSPLEAAKKISGTDYTGAQAAKKATPQKTDTWKQIVPAPQPGQIIHHHYGKPTRVWEYRLQDGKLAGLICRFDLPDGKQVLPFTYGTNGTGKFWQFRGFDRPRPLYNLPAICADPKPVVVVCEGEKTADAAGRLLPKTVTTCWQAGSWGWKYTDWKPLSGRRLILWPDNDVPGLKAMIAVAEMLITTGISTDVKIVIPPAAKPKGWDLADAETDGWSTEITRAHTLGHLYQYNSPEISAALLNAPGQTKDEAPAPTPEQSAQEPTAAYTAPAVPDPPPPAPAAPKDDPRRNNQFFEVLGFEKEGDRQVFSFYIKDARIVVKYSASALGSKSNLLTLAPLYYWEDTYPEGKRKGGFSIDMAVQELVSTANRSGVFSPKYIRGRGAWMDSGRIVLHLGNCLMVDGREVPLGSLRTRYVYEAAEPLDMRIDNPLDLKTAHRLMDIVKLLNWDRDVDAYLLAGWCVIAPVCGALRWRPHIWITGSAGTGKSWVFREIVRRLLGNACLAVQSETSEAGLRQLIGTDAVPVVFDEAEGETRAGLERMEHVLALMRAASSSDGGVLAKGTATGGGKVFVVRSCFAFASINSPVSLQSDRTRITNLVLTEPEPDVKAARWVDLQRVFAEIMTPGFISGLQARTIRLLPTILNNAEVFAAAAAAHLGQQRIGDQLGALLAGAYSLASDRPVQFETALAWLQKHNWSEERNLDATKDELSLFAYLMEKIVKMDGIEGIPVERNLGELIRIAAAIQPDTKIHALQAQERLKRLGFKVDGNYLLISNASDAVRTWLRETAWAKNFNRTLLRIKGADTTAAVRFGSGITTRAVRLPLALLQ